MACQIETLNIKPHVCPFEVLEFLLQENKLTTTIQDFTTKTTKTKFSQQLANQNRKLKNLENPFEPGGYTWEFIERSIKLAETYDLFRKNYWTPFVAAREKLVTNERKSGGMIYLEENTPTVILPGNKGKVKVPLLEAMGKRRKE